MGPITALLVFAVAVGLYQVGGTPELRGELHYITQGAVIAYLLFRELTRNPSPFVRLVLVLGVVEELQVSLCGIGSWGIIVPAGSGLCVEKYGVWPYAITATCSVLYLMWAYRATLRNALQKGVKWLLQMVPK